MSRKTAATSTIQITSAPILLLAFELGEESWLLGFSRGFGEKVLRRKIKSIRRKIKSRDTTALMQEVARAKQQLELADDTARERTVSVVSVALRGWKQASSKDRDRGLGEKAPDCLVALRRIRGGAKGGGNLAAASIGLASQRVS